MQVAGRLNPGKNQLIERHRAAPSIARGPCHGTAGAAKAGPPRPSRGAGAPPPVLAGTSASVRPLFEKQGGRDARGPRGPSKSVRGGREEKSAPPPRRAPAGSRDRGRGPPR